MTDAHAGSVERPNNHVSTFPYPGGKGRGSDWILEKVPEHRCFVEVFGGSAALTYNKPPSQNEVYNDVNDDLVQFFETLRERTDELTEWVKNVPYSRSLYDDWVADYFDGVRPDDPIRRAGRFWTLRYMQFAGDISSPNGFKTRAKKSPARTFDNARHRLNVLADRFHDVIIENKDYTAILEDYDQEAVLFYMDPPYVDAEHYYDCEFNHDDFVDVLHDVEADWMVSYETLPDGLDDFHIVERTRRHRMCRGTSDATERLVCNFDPSERERFVRVGLSQTTLGGGERR
ncbi:DNA adenine methylase [Haloarchaeobius sp. DFWS5]|uniref:DNA adenine methylase n=1 Tax=Haloarchaeobius sp. DFWS5 TaxID=3446114 RepID=UPI003EB87A19